VDTRPLVDHSNRARVIRWGLFAPSRRTAGLNKFRLTVEMSVVRRIRIGGREAPLASTTGVARDRGVVAAEADAAQRTPKSRSAKSF